MSPDFRVRDVVPEERRERTVSFISDPHHSPTHAVNRSHPPPSTPPPAPPGAVSEMLL